MPLLEMFCSSFLTTFSISCFFIFFFLPIRWEPVAHATQLEGSDQPPPCGDKNGHHFESSLWPTSLTAYRFSEKSDADHSVFNCRCAVDYAYACSLAAPLMKANVDRSTPTITKSVRKGIQAAKKASLVGQKQKILKLQRVGENISVRMKSAPVEKTSTTLDKGDSETKGVTCEKKRKTRRSRQLSLLDQQEKQELQKRCKSILDNVVDCP